MAYIPPHKRHHKDGDRSAPTPSPIPISLNPRFKETLNLGSSRRRQDRHGAGKIVYAADSIFRWWPVGAAADGDPIPVSFRLEPFDWETIEQRDGEKPLVLVSGGGLEESAGEEQDTTPWVSITERVVPDLIAAAASARDELKHGGDEEAKLYFMAKSGKNVFPGGSSVSLDYIKKAASAPINSTNKLRKIFCTNVPHSHMENAQITVAPKIGLSFHSQKDHYHILISDKHRPDLTITCKCTITESGQLRLYKIEENIVRHLVADISCLYKKLDLRLFLFTRRKMKIIDNEENEALNKIVMSAIIDPDVKGGLRWPIGKQYYGERFSVVGAWHTKCITLRSDKMRLVLRHADRFDYMKSTGEVASELSLKMIEIARLLKEGDIESNLLEVMVQEVVKLFWDHLLS
ncbi:uncharacterized protein LOC110018428 isoform X2 [Phalaenopsis equestris]|uniref:uncharacterized protein LOC110018428 isoform X2 n=1 Tax=Phalaenopsis equestris TaxID=78828 RepID=UPI0009E3600B|nr:uncharacterized protein LOC110018428 isoform X2 [Phalaenopsis equestris]